eukprot:UN08889
MRKERKSKRLYDSIQERKQTICEKSHIYITFYLVNLGGGGRSRFWRHLIYGYSLTHMQQLTYYLSNYDVNFSSLSPHDWKYPKNFFENLRKSYICIEKPEFQTHD